MTEQVLNTPVEQTSTGQVMENKTATTPSASVEPAEKQVPQSEVGRIAGAARKEGQDKGYEKGYQDAYSKFQQQQVNPPVQQAAEFTPHVAQPHSAQNTNNNLAELVSRQVAETLKKEREEIARVTEEKRIQDYYTQLSTQLTPKINAAKDKYSDFEQSIAKLYLDKNPRAMELLEWVNSVPNAGEVLYDIAKNPHKIGILNSMHAPELAIQQIHEISQSLQNNQLAQDKSLPRHPLSSIEPSHVGKSSETLSGQQLTDHARIHFRL